MMRFTSSFKLQ